jgi:hypothetical protein
MAKAKKIQVKVALEPVVTYSEDTHVELVLTQDEAEFLQDVMGSIGGDPKTSRRKYQNSIINALYNVGINAYMRSDDKHGSIYFGMDPTGDYINRLKAQIVELGSDPVY